MVNIGVLGSRPKVSLLLIALQKILINATVFAAEENSLSRSSYLLTWENKRLVGHVAKRFQSQSLTSCSHSCLRNSWCTSTNFKKTFKEDNKGTCELNKAGITGDNQITDQPGVTFSVFLKGCLMTGCLNGGSCLFEMKTETFACSCRVPWIGDKCEKAKTLGYGRSCTEIKAKEGKRAVSGIYWLNGTGFEFLAYCHMESTAKGWTLIARFSNNDAKNWMQDSGDWWYDRNVAVGETFNPSSNTDMISPAFWLVSGNEFKITRSDDPLHTALLQTTGYCLRGQTFRSKVTRYGNFRNGNSWDNGRCRGDCRVQYGGQYKTTQGFIRAECNGTLQRADEIGFWCASGQTWSGSVMMVGGGEGACSYDLSHGIGITAAIHSSFDARGRDEYGFGDSLVSQTAAYSLNLWIR